MSSLEDFDAQWRASAHEAVPYTEDLPECLQVFPEPIDGCLAQGKATQVQIDCDLRPDNSLLTITDNGKGITNLSRLLSWASSSSTEIHHRYGHGTKKFLSKWCRDYKTAKWEIQYRNKDRRGVSSSLKIIRPPFLGSRTIVDEDETNETTVWPSGTRISLQFDKSILGAYQTPLDLFLILKEIIRVRYSQKFLNETEFLLSIYENGTLKKSESSKKANWFSLEEGLRKEVSRGNAFLAYNERKEIEGGILHYREYRITIKGKKVFPLSQEFPKFGQKSMKTSRAHISLDGRTIESRPLHKIYGRDSNHNDFNGWVGFIDIVPTDENSYSLLPTPCTTKVSFYENCPNFKKLMREMAEILKKPSLPASTPAPEPAAVAAVPTAPVVAPQPAAAAIVPTAGVQQPSQGLMLLAGMTSQPAAATQRRRVLRVASATRSAAPAAPVLNASVVNSHLRYQSQSERSVLSRFRDLVLAFGNSNLEEKIETSSNQTEPGLVEIYKSMDAIDKYLRDSGVVPY